MALLDLPDNHDISHLNAALRFVEGFRVAVDGGAHKGIWTRNLVKEFKEVWAFEPIHNVEAKGNVIKIKCALSDKNEHLTFSPGTENTGQWHVSKDGEIKVETHPLDWFELHDVDFLKLDVEGYELKALIGATETIKRNRPVILIEENGLCERYGIKHGEAGQFLEGMGYEMVLRKNKDYIYKYRHSS